MTRRILLAPNAFKGTFDAVQVAGIWRAALARRRGIVVDERPLSDGGDGFLAVVRHYRPRVLEIRVRTRDPLGRPLAPAWGWDPAARAAYVESALAVGLRLLGPSERRPLEATSAGLGGLLLAAAAVGVQRVTVGLGGSSTVDGGLGLARALGYRFEDDHDRPIERPEGLERLRRILAPPSRPLDGIRIVALADVDHPLLGAGGAAAVFGPQKGADPATVERLEAGLERLAERWTSDLGAPADLAGRRGSGAAGGLGAGLVVFVAARLERGAAWCARLAGLEAALRGADGVVTGEGCYDAQSERGSKGTGWVLARAARARVPAAIACARAEAAAAARARSHGVAVVDAARAGLSPGGLGREDLATLVRAALAELGSATARSL